MLARLNGSWYKTAFLAFMAVIAAHWLEHIFQAYQVFVLGWPRSQANGALGLLDPWLVTSEWLHYVHAVLMLVGLIVFRPSFQGSSRPWWDAAIAIQVWHHFEHALLLGQALLNTNLFGLPVRTSLLQLVIPRVELHLFYNAAVLAPMLVAIFQRHRESHNGRVLGWGVPELSGHASD